jgi:hypothetical protein
MKLEPQKNESDTRMHSEMAGKVALVTGVRVVSAPAIGFLSKR